jgi:type VI secretion system protein ImpJ
MRQLQRVLWTKGVLLTPQHLQLQDRFLEDQFAFRLQAHTFCPWGFSRLEVDREALSGGVFALRSAAGLFGDGLPFEIGAADPAVPPRPLGDHWKPDQDSLDIYLAIPEPRPGGLNIAVAPGEGDTRYLAEVVLRRDEITGLGERPLQVARKNFRFVIEGESLEGNSVLKVARVLHSTTGGIRLDPRFVPPLLDIGASEYLLSILRRLLEILAARSSALAGARRQRNLGLADFGASDVANFWLLYTINTHLPRFRHLFEVRRGHPADLFAAILELCGALTTFSSSIHPREFPKYDHADPGGPFTELDELVRGLLETVVPAGHIALPLREERPMTYATAIDEDRYLTAPQLILAVSATLAPAELARRVPTLVKISSTDQVDKLIRQALPGVGLRHLPSPPNSIPVKLDYQYFQLERAGSDWEAIRRMRNLAVYIPSDFPDPRLELLVLLPSE